MAQFTVYRNKDRRTKSDFPLLLDVQADLLTDLRTRVVVPLTKVAKLTKKPIERLTPVVELDGDRYLMLTPQLAGIAKSDLGPAVGNLAEERHAIVDALDFLFTGS